MVRKYFYVGIDLGTTNSAAAVFDGEQLSLVRNAQGSSLTPSVVRIDARGSISVGARAQRFLDSDPTNTRAEFKRLMGTETPLEFAAARITRRPEELAAEVLRSLRQDATDQLGFAPEQAVISVPALFELPQSAATTAAARLAGFQKAELIQEPIASALAAGWTQSHSNGHWLVYDLGGGTFDVSLLQSEEGRLRVVGHDGDNFLGGRDFDAALVHWVLDFISQQHGLLFDRTDPRIQPALRKLKRMVEEAKIELSRQHHAALTYPEFVLQGNAPFDIDVVLDRTILHQQVRPLWDRSLEVCQRLCRTHGIQPNQLQRIVFVGGPTLTPGLREYVAHALGAPVAEGVDPMTIVAQGAALYAATLGLLARPQPQTSSASPSSGSPYSLWLQHPAVSTDIKPHVVGRLLQGETGIPPTEVRLRRADGQWESSWTAFGAQGAFVLSVELVPRQSNTFFLEARSAQQQPVAISPAEITIVQGVTLGDPPLSRTVGVALANDRVQVYFERGCPLPTRRTFTQYTVETVVPDKNNGFALKIPIVQGEHDQAHLCRLVGTLEIPSQALSGTLPVGSALEITLSLDRGGQLSARALAPAVGQVFEQVAHLLVPQADPTTLQNQLHLLAERVNALRTSAFQRGDAQSIERFGAFERLLQEAQKDISLARGGDADAGQKARRHLLDLDAVIEEAELDQKWPEIEEDTRQWLAATYSFVSDTGTPQERRLLDETSQAIEIARAQRNVVELQRQLRVVKRLNGSAFYRDPNAWEYKFEEAAADATQAVDGVRAQSLIQEGRRAIAVQDKSKLQQVVRELWKLIPARAEERKQSYESGVRSHE